MNNINRILTAVRKDDIVGLQEAFADEISQRLYKTINESRSQSFDSYFNAHHEPMYHDHDQYMGSPQTIAAALKKGAFIGARIGSTSLGSSAAVAGLAAGAIIGAPVGAAASGLKYVLKKRIKNKLEQNRRDRERKQEEEIRQASAEFNTDETDQGQHTNQGTHKHG